MKIITVPDPRLRLNSTKVNHINDETREIVDKMITASLEWEKAHPFELSAAMAAPQLGINKRIIIIRDNMDDKAKNTFTALVDPEVIKTEGKTIFDYEGCLSIPNIYGLVPRPNKARIKAKLLDGTEIRLKADGGLARTLLHEIDHLNGVLFVDYIKDKKDSFFELDENGEITPLDYDQKIAPLKGLFSSED